MMGRESPPQASLFYTGINLDNRVRSDQRRCQRRCQALVSEGVKVSGFGYLFMWQFHIVRLKQGRKKQYQISKA